MEIAGIIFIILVILMAGSAGAWYFQRERTGWDKERATLLRAAAEPSCNHKWRIENKDTMPSAWSQLPQPADSECATTEPPEWLFRATVATTYICILCGAMRTEVVTNRDEPKS